MPTRYTYSCLWRFSFNAQKSKVVVFGKTNHLVHHSWTLGNNSISVSDNYKHLGIIQQTKFNSTERTTISCNKGRKSYFSIRNDLSCNTNPITLLSLYRKVVLPSLLYGCEIWNNLKTSDLHQRLVCHL
jgi:hypothetical protein